VRLRIAGGIVLAWVILAAVLAVIGLRARPKPADVAIVFANTVNPNGQPSARLAARLDAARSLYDEHLVHYLVVSGGTGKEGFDEAAIMKRYLVSRGIPDSVILADTRGTNTTHTARNVRTLMRERHWSTADLVTQYFHVVRAEWACRQEGIRVVGAHAPRFFEARDLYSMVREAIAFPVYVFKRSG
jgi:vancomycin permeability regulator SanA